MDMRDGYDAVVIGAGIGGLTCGALLAKSGLSVLVADRNSKPGGYCTSFQHDGFSFDNGLCYLLGCEPRGVIHETLEELALRQNLELVKMDPALRIIGSSYDLRISSAESMDSLTDLFPMEALAIRKFVVECRATATQAQILLDKSLDLMNIWQKLALMSAFPFRYRKMMKYMTKSCQEMVASFFKNPKLRAIALSSYPYNGTGAVALMIMALLGNTERLYYPKGGFQALANLLTEGVRKYGGDIALDTMVSRILIKDDRAVGVELSDGTEVKARHVVSNVDATQTFLKLVGEERLTSKLKKELATAQLSPPGFVVSLGVNLNLKAMGFDEGLIIYNPSDDIGELFGTDLEKCIVSITMHSNLDPAQAPDNATAVELLAVLPYDLVEDWGTEEESVADKLIASAGKVIPGLSDHIVCKHIVSPFAFEQSTLNSQGVMMGWQSVPGTRLRSQKTPIKNLYQAGQWTFAGGGLTTVVASGRNAAQLVLRSE